LTCPRYAQYAGGVPVEAEFPVQITLNGEPYEIEQPLSVAELLARLEIDSRRVAIEYNLSILKRYAFPQTMVGEGDRLEIVNFVGGG
jgi:thiamine biosynthesis protein ThiS